MRFRRIAKRAFNLEMSSGRDKYHWFIRRGVIKFDYIRLSDKLLYGPFTFNVVGEHTS